MQLGNTYSVMKIENIPPSSSALLQHIKRAALQAGHIWGQALVAKPTLPSPADWDGRLTPEVNGPHCG